MLNSSSLKKTYARVSEGNLSRAAQPMQQQCCEAQSRQQSAVELSNILKRSVAAILVQRYAFKQSSVVR